MAGDSIRFTRDALRAIVGHMKAGDKLTLVTFSTMAQTIFSNLDVEANRGEIMIAISGLQPSGSTNMLAGLELTYDWAQRNYDTEMLNRVILFGDGASNVGNNKIASYENLTRINGQEGIYLTGVGVGNYYDFERMDRLTDAGKGAHLFLPNSEEVGLIFGEYFIKLIEVAADSIEIVMKLPAGTVLETFSGEEVSTNPEEKVQNIILAAGDDMTFTARFKVEREEAWVEPVELSITYRPLGSGAPVTKKVDVAKFEDLVAAPGALFNRTRLVRDFAFHATDQTHPDLKSVSELSSDMDLIKDDWGITEIVGLFDCLEGSIPQDNIKRPTIHLPIFRR
jgi:Ca-activated chloride channel family protein